MLYDMKISALTRLPLSFLIISIALLVAAAPAQTATEYTATSLDPDSFHSTIATGIWFIEFFSPYCPHCRAFRPTWETVVGEIGKTPSSPINVAQVNCALYGDLCRELEIDGYPKLNIYEDGKYSETFNGAREIDNLFTFLSKYTATTTTTSVAEPEPTEPVIRVNPSGELLVLTSENFAEEIGKGKVFVKFFAPWCGHCQKLAPTWTRLAEQMRNQLTIAEVNCDTYGALCQSQGVPGYPMLAYYDDDGVKTEYTGGRKLHQLDAFVERLIAPAVQQLSFESFESQVQASDVLYLLLRSPSDAKSSTLVTKASTVLLGSPPVFESTSESLSSYLTISPSSLPILIVFKDGDVLNPAATMSLKPSDTIDVVKSWFLRHRLPTALELDSDNFQQVMNPKHMAPPLVLIAAVSEKNGLNSLKKLKRIGKKWREEKAQNGARDVVFAWMDASKWGKWLKSMYGIKGADEAQNAPIVVADHNRLIYYDVDGSDAKIALTAASIGSALDGILDGSIGYRHSENAIERLARFFNDKLISLGSFVTENPRTMIFLGLAVLVVFGLFVRRLLADSGDDIYSVKSGKYEKLGGGQGRKSSRLD